MTDQPKPKGHPHIRKPKPGHPWAAYRACATTPQPNRRATHDVEIEIRRPEVLPVAERLHQEHPTWSAKKCLERAKSIITTKPTHPAG